MKPSTIASWMLCACIAVAARAEVNEAERYWGQWRGPRADGLAPHADPPLEWSESRNIRWKVEIPGSGLSTPIVWKDRLYLHSAVPTNKETNEHRFVVIALHRQTGRTVWEKTVCQTVPHEGHHEDGSYASASPLTDGRQLYCYFGSRGLYCLDFDGNVLWSKDLGDMKTRNGFGEGSSPTLAGDKLLVTWDHEGDSFIVALRAADGEELWRQARDEPTSWATPFVLPEGDRLTAVVPGSKRVRAYDVAAGKLLWECAGLGTNCIPMPVAGHGMVFAMSGHREPGLLAIRYAGAAGDLTDSNAVAWSLKKEGTPYVPSPLLYDGLLFFPQKNTQILRCYDAVSGTLHFTERLEKINGIYASLVGAKDRVYVLGRNGVAYVLRKSPKLEVLAINELDDHFDASPALVDKEIFLRGRRHVYCIAAE